MPTTKGPSWSQDPPGLGKGLLHVLHELQRGEEEDQVKAPFAKGQILPPARHPDRLRGPGLAQAAHGLRGLEAHLPRVGEAPEPVPRARPHSRRLSPGGRRRRRALSSSAMTKAPKGVSYQAS